MSESDQPVTSGAVPKKPLPTFLQWLPWEKFTIWGLFLLVVYTLRHFFFIIFMTFILTYIMRSVVMWMHSRVAPERQTPWMERLLSVLCFGALLFAGYGIGSYFGPKLIDQGEALAVRLRRVDPQEEFRRVLADTIGAYLFSEEFADPQSEIYESEFETFRKEGHQYFRATRAFIDLRRDILDGFVATHQSLFEEYVPSAGAGGDDFDRWLLREKIPELLAETEVDRRTLTGAIEHISGLDDGKSPDAAGTQNDDVIESIRESLLRLAKIDPAKLDDYRFEWNTAQAEMRFEELKKTAVFEDAFSAYYRKRREEDPIGVPYKYERFRELDGAYIKSPKALSDALGETERRDDSAMVAQLREDFRKKKQAELAQQWWETSSTADEFRRHVSGGFNDFAKGAADWLRGAITIAIERTVQFALSLLLSFFITFDMPNLTKGVERLKESRLRDFYEEISPGLINFGRLIGRAVEAQGVIALANSLLTLIAIKLLGIENEIFLCAVVFLCSFIPVLGVVFSSVPIAVMAIIQPGGSFLLAILAFVAILIIHFIETSMLNPKILGDMLHLHPVVVLAVLAVGEHFFGVWGLLLGVPVTVYIFRFVILNEGIPGFIELVPATPTREKTGIPEPSEIEMPATVEPSGADGTNRSESNGPPLGQR